MKRKPSVLVLDDDPLLLKMISMKIQRRLPPLDVATTERPFAVCSYDIYILDNDFRGRTLAADLAEAIVEQQPDSLVLALSGTLDTQTLKRLINCGCAGAFDKGQPAEIDAMIDHIQARLSGENPGDDAARNHRGGVGGTARAISTLIRDWNRRLELEESRTVDATRP